MRIYQTTSQTTSHFQQYLTITDDDVCYPITQFAIYNRLECDKELHLMSEYAHEAMNVQVNDRVYNWLCGSRIVNPSLMALKQE